MNSKNAKAVISREICILADSRNVPCLPGDLSCRDAGRPLRGWRETMHKARACTVQGRAIFVARGRGSTVEQFLAKGLESGVRDPYSLEYQDEEDSMRASAHTRRTHAARQISFVSGLCMGCALWRHDFEEITDHVRGDDDSLETGVPQARIDGRQHVLRSILTASGTCNDCGKSVTSLYIPMG